MKALKFTLSGKTAIFKKPDVNSYNYYTYGSIHKVALLGVFGAVLGLDGYNQQSGNFPDFYTKLKDTEICIKINNARAYTDKKIQTFNNSVGYASKEEGGNLLVNEQWLFNPEWDIFILINDDVSEQLSESIINNKATYIPYLGKNDHPANIVGPIIINLEKTKTSSYINSLYMAEDEELEYLVAYGNDKVPWKYEEFLPIGLDENTNLYQKVRFRQTNMKISNLKLENLYQWNDQVLQFY